MSSTKSERSKSSTHYLYKGRTIRFLRGGGGGGWKNLEKNILQTQKQEKKYFYSESSKKNISCRNGKVKKSCKLTFLSTELFT